MNKIDHIIFRQLVNIQIYSCECFKDGMFVGNTTDVGGVSDAEFGKLSFGRAFLFEGSIFCFLLVLE
ncbi:hypothetical protein ACYULU_07210 [Breznakiellaceae bacterium SP9]